jgi:cytochrome P450
MHYSKEIWGEDAHEFRPTRWLEDDIAAKEKYWIPVRFPATFFFQRVNILSNITQFGAGYGSCPGQNIAKIELAKIAATLVRDYKIKQVDGTQAWKWKAYFTVVPHSWPVFVEKTK